MFFAGFVPWASIRVTRTRHLLMDYADLRFQGGGRLAIEAHVADRLWRAAPGRWPEPGPAPAPDGAREALVYALKEWAVLTAFASAFFLIVPRLSGEKKIPLEMTVVSVAGKPDSQPPVF